DQREDQDGHPQRVGDVEDRLVDVVGGEAEDRGHRQRLPRSSRRAPSPSSRRTVSAEPMIAQGELWTMRRAGGVASAAAVAPPWMLAPGGSGVTLASSSPLTSLPGSDGGGGDDLSGVLVLGLPEA